MISSLNYHLDFSPLEDVPPMCSMHVINPDRSWYEPWRFLLYGLVHKDLTHLAKNVFCQLFFGVPLELSHGSRRVGAIYLSAIFLGGVGREIFCESKVPLAGASGISVFSFKINIRIFSKLSDLCLS